MPRRNTVSPMESEEITRTDFPVSPDGYDRRAVDAHLAAVAAQVEALRARIEALGVEIEALREDAPASAPVGTGSTAPVPARPVPPAGHEVEAGERGGGVGDLSDDPVSARLVVSKMHLDGMGREEIIDRLGAGYRLEDPEVLVDEVIEGLS